MALKWIDKKSTLYFGKRIYKAGDVIPAGSLPEKRIKILKSQNKISESDIVKNITTNKTEFLGHEIEINILPGNENSDKIPDVKSEKKMLYGMIKNDFLKLTKQEKKKVKAEWEMLNPGNSE